MPTKSTSHYALILALSFAWWGCGGDDASQLNTDTSTPAQVVMDTSADDLMDINPADIPSSPDTTPEEDTESAPDTTSGEDSAAIPDTTMAEDSSPNLDTIPAPDTAEPDTIPELDTSPLTDTTPENDTYYEPDTTVLPDTTVFPDTTVAPDTTETPDTTAEPDTSIEPDTSTPPPPPVFRFAVQSDIHISQDAVTPNGVKASARGTVEYVQPSFVFFNGDMTSGTTTSPTDPDVITAYWDEFFNAFSAYVPANIYYFPVRGNHDRYTTLQKNEYYYRWENHQVPGLDIDGNPAEYYSFDYMNSHFVVLDGADVSIETEQMDWLESDLATAQDMSHRFVFSHIPLEAKVFDSSGGIGYGEIKGTTSTGTSLPDVLLAGNVDVLFVGHEHVYVNDPDVDGIWQVTCGTASATYTFQLLDGTWQAKTPNFVVVDVDGDDFDVYDVRDEPFFTTTWEGTTIPNPPPRLLGDQTPPEADILIVEGWQRGSLWERAAIWDTYGAIMQQLSQNVGYTVSYAIVDQGAVASGQVILEDYDVVIWVLVNEGIADRTFTLMEQSYVKQALAAGMRLIVTGAEVGYDLVEYDHGAAYFGTYLGAVYESDDAKDGTVLGVAGTIFQTFTSTFPETVAPYKYPDVISPTGGAELLLTYGNGKGAAVGLKQTFDNGVIPAAVVYFGFALDGLDGLSQQTLLLQLALQYVGWL